jgi:DtxR family Mn-dependent transcriptional regulator
MLSLAEENYLKAIYHLASNGQSVLTNEIAEAMQTKAASVTDMLKKLSAKALIHYQPYYGVTITSKGKNQALTVIRKHRLWETFLVQKLGFSWDEVHEVAEQLEHIQSSRLIDKLDEYLGHPTVDPHGDPIPDHEGRIKTVPLIAMDQVKPGMKGIITSVKDSDPELLKYLHKIGATPGKKVTVVSREAYDESVEILLDKKSIFLSKEVSRNILLSI